MNLESRPYCRFNTVYENGFPATILPLLSYLLFLIVYSCILCSLEQTALFLLLPSIKSKDGDSGSKKETTEYLTQTNIYLYIFKYKASSGARWHTR